MLKPFLQAVAMITAISVGSLSLTATAAPTNPWGGNETAVSEPAPQQAAPQPAEVADAKPAEDDANPANDNEKPDANKTDFDPKAAKIDENKVPELEKAKEGKVVVARVVWVKGTFTAIEPDLSTRRELKANSVIYLHDTLQTPPRSTAQIIFTDNASMTFRPDTVFHIEDYQYDKDAKPDAKKNRYVMDLVTGGFRTVTGLIAEEDPDSYAVNTPVATIGVRGTEYSIVYKEGQDLFIQQYQGKPCMRNEASKGKRVCLDNDRRYGQVDRQTIRPQVVAQQPTVFVTDVEVVPVSFTKGTVPGSSAPTESESLGGGGSFCIQ